ncbi:MAG TPA: hypothetical protein VE594_00535 [Nitrososphaeraceae archaeon]|nr:hypothetical protein [Nitrososphaeraceae archaeon]
MKSYSYAVLIVTLLTIVSSTVVQGSGSETEQIQKDSEKSKLSKPNNLTQNDDDSVYPQISSSSDNIYIVWQESVGSYGTTNYDIFFKRSNDDGNSFGSPINLSDNVGFSEHPQIASVGNHIYVVWVDDSSGQREIMFSKSLDRGKTFSNSIVVSQNSLSPYHAELAAEGQDVYIVWNSFGMEIGNIIFLAKSNDEGKTFGKLIEIGEGDLETYPKIAASANEYYITWDRRDHEDTEILLIKGHKDYNNIQNVTQINKLNNENIDGGESQVAADSDHVIVTWTSNIPVNKKYVYVSKSINNGNAFGDNIPISSTNSSNVENILIDDNSYIIWQDNVHGNYDIFYTKGNSNGTGTDKPINVSNNIGVSECPSITVSTTAIHMTWEDDTTGNHEVLYKKLSKMA